MYRRKIIVPKRHVIGALSLSTSSSSPSPTIYHPSSSHPFSFSTFVPYFLRKSSPKIYSVCIFFTWPPSSSNVGATGLLLFFFMTYSCLFLSWDASAAMYFKVSSNPPSPRRGMPHSSGDMPRGLSIHFFKIILQSFC